MLTHKASPTGISNPITCCLNANGNLGSKTSCAFPISVLQQLSARKPGLIQVWWEHPGTWPLNTCRTRRFPQRSMFILPPRHYMKCWWGEHHLEDQEAISPLRINKSLDG